VISVLTQYSEGPRLDPKFRHPCKNRIQIIMCVYNKLYLPQEGRIFNVSKYLMYHMQVSFNMSLATCSLQTFNILEKLYLKTNVRHYKTRRVILPKGKPNSATNIIAYHKATKLNLKLNSVAWVRERIVPTERPPLVGKVSAYFCG
jgi:hypothetical protein